MKIFLDTEFTDLIAPKLISIGLVAASGEKFYAEVPYSLDECSEFVKAAVLPLLNPASFACSASDLSFKLNDWLSQVRPGLDDLEICFDYQTDWDLLFGAMGNYMPYWCVPRRVGVSVLVRQQFHQATQLSEHHALNDAMSLHYGFYVDTSKMWPF